MVKGGINSRERIKGALSEFVNEINSPGEKGKEGGREKKYPRISTQIPTQIPICCCTNSEIVFCAKNNRDTSNKRVTHFSKSLVHARTPPTTTLVPWHTTFGGTFPWHFRATTDHFTNRPIHKDKRRRPRMGGGRGGGSRFVARGWRSSARRSGERGARWNSKRRDITASSFR